MERRKLIFSISKLAGGGAEKVLLLLAQEMLNNGYGVLVLVTNQKKTEAIIPKAYSKLNIRFAEEEIGTISTRKLSFIPIRLICRLCSCINLTPPDFAARESFLYQYAHLVSWLRAVIHEEGHCSIVAFLQPTNQAILMATEGLSNPVILSERSDPHRYLKSRYASFFLKTYYTKVKRIVFQTPYAMSCYPEYLQNIGIVIPNPLAEDIPNPYNGSRVKKIVNFCRLTPEKNLPLLINAFDKFRVNHRDYVLEIIGDGPMRPSIEKLIREKRLCKQVLLTDYIPNVLEYVQKNMMFVSTSDWEGLSNSMLEAMAIGLPTICTDCGGGGARYIIRDHENGLLVPVGNCERLCDAMCEIADNMELRNRLSQESAKIKELLSKNEIVRKWEEILK